MYEAQAIPKKQKLRFDKRWFNPLYFVLGEIMRCLEIRTVFVYGGKSSAKTQSITQHLVRVAMYGHSSIGFRKESTLIQTTLKKTFNKAISTTRLSSAFEKLQFMYRNKVSGAEIVLKGLDDPEKAKGVESYRYLYLDELNQFAYEEWEQFTLSLRGLEGQKIFASWNPVSENSWVKKQLIDTLTLIDTDEFGSLPNPDSFIKISDDRRTVVIRTNYMDNYWIVGSPCGTYGYRDENLIHEYESLQGRNYNAYRVNVLGEWGAVRTGNEFFKQFDETKHIGHAPVDLNTTIHVSLDENVNPYVTATIWQVYPAVKKLNQVHEIMAKQPDNNAPKAAAKMVQWLKNIGYGNVLYIYGDPSAGKRSTVDENSASFYDKYIDVLNKAGFRTHKRVGKSAPEVALSAAFINDVLESNYAGWAITISSTCTASAEDYMVVKEDADGKMLKEKVKDKTTGITYEPHGHCFVGETMITTLSGDKRIDEIQIGDLVLTRNGYKPVLNVFDNGCKEVVSYSILGKEIICTPEHKIFTTSGFKEAKTLTRNDIFCILDETKNICYQSNFCTTGLAFVDTLIQRICQIGDTLKDGLILTVSDLKPIYIVSNGWKSMAQFQKVIMFIILMAISTITPIVIWSLLTTNDIFNTITQLVHRKVKTRKRNVCLPLQYPPLKHGTLQNKVRFGTVKMLKNVLLIGKQKAINAIAAANRFLQIQPIPQSFVPTIASQSTGEARLKTGWNGFALYVRNDLSAISTIKHVRVVENAESLLPQKRNVYDIEVQDEHEYFANGVLVHNCSDTFRYLVTQLLANEWQSYKQRQSSGNIGRFF